MLCSSLCYTVGPCCLSIKKFCIFMLIKFLFWVSYPKNHFLKSWSFSSMFSSLTYKVFSLMFKSLIYSELNFCIWYNIRVQLHSFAYGYPIFPKPFVEKSILFSPNDLGAPFQSSFAHICKDLFLSSLFYSISIYVGLYAGTTLFRWL